MIHRDDHQAPRMHLADEVLMAAQQQVHGFAWVHAQYLPIDLQAGR